MVFFSFLIQNKIHLLLNITKRKLYLKNVFHIVCVYVYNIIINFGIVVYDQVIPCQAIAALETMPSIEGVLHAGIQSGESA